MNLIFFFFLKSHNPASGLLPWRGDNESHVLMSMRTRKDQLASGNSQSLLGESYFRIHITIPSVSNSSIENLLLDKIDNASKYKPKPNTPESSTRLAYTKRVLSRKTKSKREYPKECSENGECKGRVHRNSQHNWLLS